jgi:hypothetical protein
MRLTVSLAAAIGVFSAAAALSSPASAATKKQLAQQSPPPVARSAAGTIIQPTTTILPDGTGHVRVIVIQRRSYLDTGTELSVGDRTYHDYVVPPDGDPGHQNWFFGPDVQGKGHYPLPGAFDGGFGTSSPF